MMRLPESLSHDEKLLRVDAVIARLGLQDVQHSIVGSDTSSERISGGQRRRVNIGIELLAE
jgi:ABC-type multidrug transport system ATPase subunit